MAEGTVKWFSEKKVLALSVRTTVRTYLSIILPSICLDSTV
jgi:hypothetical protein